MDMNERGRSQIRKAVSEPSPCCSDIGHHSHSPQNGITGTLGPGCLIFFTGYSSWTLCRLTTRQSDVIGRTFFAYLEFSSGAITGRRPDKSRQIFPTSPPHSDLGQHA